MNASTHDDVLAVAPAHSPGRLLRIYYLEARCEFLRVLRTPGFAIPTLAFPLMFFLFFGVLFATGPHAQEQAMYTLAGLGSFGVIGPGLFGFGVGFALDRGLGWLQVKRASPMPPSAYLLAKVAMSMLFALLVVVLMFSAAAALAHVSLGFDQWLILAVTLVLGAIPFCAMGLAIGSWTKPQAAPAVVNLLFMPMSFLSGLWLPLQFLPKFLQNLAVILPPYHLGRLAVGAIGLEKVDVLPHVLALAAFTVFFLLLARRGYRRSAAA
ncbi:MAG TPA: ABC transporter permease [Gammaproteobacteria bacterium]|nr:ABC transporter permease [Gammaproteobacteria bacterium]